MTSTQEADKILNEIWLGMKDEIGRVAAGGAISHNDIATFSENLHFLLSNSSGLKLNEEELIALQMVSLGTKGLMTTRNP